MSYYTHDPDIVGNPFTPAEQEAVRRANEARERNREIADAIGLDPHLNSGQVAEILSAPMSSVMSTPSSPGSVPSYSPSYSGSSGGGGGYSYSYGGGGGVGGGGLSTAETKEQAQRQIDFIKELLGSDAFTAQLIRPDPGMMKAVRKAGRKDVRAARRSYGQLDRYLNRTEENPYRTTHVARAPGREGRQSAAAFKNVLKILGADTREANKSRHIEGRLGRQDAVSEIRSGRNAFLAGLRMQAWQQQMQQQAMYNQARMQMLAQMAQLYGTAGGEMPDLSAILGQIAPPPPPTPQGPGGNGGGNRPDPNRPGGPGVGTQPVGNNRPRNNGVGGGGLASAGVGGGSLPVESRGLVPPMSRQGFTDDFNVLPMPAGRTMPNFDQFVGAPGRPVAPWMFNRGQFEEVDRDGKPIPRPPRRRRGPGSGGLS